MPTRRINPHHHAQRGAARFFGVVLSGVGGVFLAVGLIDFFAAFGSARHGPPEKFWCAFVGLLLLGLGITLLKVGYLGAMTRYVAGETAPVAGDTFDALAHGAAPGVRAIARAAREGLAREDLGRRCGACGEALPADARFCPECGSLVAVATATCTACGQETEADDRFCKHCGAEQRGAGVPRGD